MPKVIVKPPTAVYFILLALCCGTAALIPFSAALAHEAGHIIAMFALGYPLKEIEITLCGAEIRGLADNIGFFGEIVILAAGGAVNLVCAAIVSSMPYRPEGAELFAACSAALALINFLPIRSLDGGRIAELALARALPARGATVINFISSAALATVWLVSVYLLLVLDGNISLLLFCLYLFVQLYLK